MKKIILSLGLIIVLASGTGFAIWHSSDSDQSERPPLTVAPISSQQPDDTDVDIAESGDVQQITQTGTMNCLPPGGENTQTLSCAIVLVAEDSTQYGLQSDDPMLIGSVPSGTKVKVSGSLIKQANSFNASGIIKVQTLERLN